MDDELVGLALVVVLAVGAQLLAARLAIPAIVPLLAVGVVAGDLTGAVDPDALLGPSLSDAISLAVGIILFEGALGLRREDLAGPVRRVVVRLVTVGAAVTWIGATLAIEAFLDVPHAIAILVGAIVIVSGPTVVLPLLDFVRPVRSVRSVLKWEGILVDPVGAIAAVIAFNALDFGGGGVSLQVGDFAGTMVAGVACGAAGAFALMPLLGARWLAERQKVAATLMAVVAAFAVGHVLRDGAGLVATIVMGIVLANQRRVDIARIVEFKETLGSILLGLLFVLLSATIAVEDVADLGLGALAVVAALVLVVRPLVTLLCTAGTGLPMRERLFVAALAPRGIVAASTASVFGLRLQEQGAAGAEDVLPIVFTVIAGTVLVYAVAAPLLARALGVAGGAPAGVLLVGAAPWARDLARALREAGADVRVWSPRAEEAQAARAEGLAVLPDPLLGDGGDAALGAADGGPAIGGPLPDAIGHVLVVTGDDALDELLAGRLDEELAAARVLTLAPSAGGPRLAARDGALGPPLFAADATAAELSRRHAAGERTRVVDGAALPPGATALATVREGRAGAADVAPALAGTDPSPRPGDLVLALAPPPA